MARFVFDHRDDVIRRLEALASTEDTSYGLVFVEDALDDRMVHILREAVKLCDRVVVASTTLKPKKAEETLLKSVGVDVLYVPPVDMWLCKTTTGKGDDVTFYLHAILAVMPMVVLYGAENLNMRRHLQNLQQTFGDVVAFSAVTL